MLKVLTAAMWVTTGANALVLGMVATGRMAFDDAAYGSILSLICGTALGVILLRRLSELPRAYFDAIIRTKEADAFIYQERLKKMDAELRIAEGLLGEIWPWIPRQQRPAATMRQELDKRRQEAERANA